MTTTEMTAAAAAFSSMPGYQQWELPAGERLIREVWELAGKLSQGFREYPTMDIPTADEISTLYTTDLTAATAAVTVLNVKYRSGYHHSAIIAGVAISLGVM